MFILSHVSYAPRGTSHGVLGPHDTLAGAKKAAEEIAAAWEGSSDGQLLGGWDEIDGDDWDRHVWHRSLHYKRDMVGAMEIYQFDEMGD